MRSKCKGVLCLDASPGTKVSCYYIGCLSLGSSFLAHFFYSFVPTGEQTGVLRLHQRLLNSTPLKMQWLRRNFPLVMRSFKRHIKRQVAFIIIGSMPLPCHHLPLHIMTTLWKGHLVSLRMNWCLTSQMQRYIVVVLLACLFYSLPLFLSYQQEDEEELISSPSLLNQTLLAHFLHFHFGITRAMVVQSSHLPSPVTSPIAKAHGCCIACMSLGSSFSHTSFVSFVPPGEWKRSAVLFVINTI